eukprot:520720-Amphidinium_carterae.1
MLPVIGSLLTKDVKLTPRMPKMLQSASIQSCDAAGVPVGTSSHSVSSSCSRFTLPTPGAQQQEEQT